MAAVGRDAAAGSGTFTADGADDDAGLSAASAGTAAIRMQAISVQRILGMINLLWSRVGLDFPLDRRLARSSRPKSSLGRFNPMNQQLP